KNAGKGPKTHGLLVDGISRWFLLLSDAGLGTRPGWEETTLRLKLSVRVLRSRLDDQWANASLSRASCSCDRLLAMISNFGPALKASTTRSVVPWPTSKNSAEVPSVTLPRTCSMKSLPTP